MIQILRFVLEKKSVTTQRCGYQLIERLPGDYSERLLQVTGDGNFGIEWIIQTVNNARRSGSILH